MLDKTKVTRIINITINGQWRRHFYLQTLQQLSIMFLVLYKCWCMCVCVCFGTCVFMSVCELYVYRIMYAHVYAWLS